MQRLKRISLSAVPRWLGVRVATSSRYQHSMAVGRLSLMVSGGTEHDRLLLTAAATLHDVGNGPFPHISDSLMKEMLGFTHEEAVQFAFDHSPVKDHLVLGKYKVDLAEVSSVLEGKHYLSRLLYGFPDLDNADNVYRFLSTIPGKPLGDPSYNPPEIAATMSLDHEKGNIPENLQRRWASDFEKLYSYVWNDEDNMICWTMLGRALRILKEILTPEFFRLTNKEAFNLMAQRLPEWADNLRRKKYKILFDEKFAQLKGEARKLSEPSNLPMIEQHLCTEAKIDEWCLGLTVDQPLLREKPDHWRVYLVSCRDNRETVSLLKDMLSASEPFQATDGARS